MVRNAAGKRSGPVEDVIAWAWREELPKRPNLAGPMAAIPSSWRTEPSVDSGGSVVINDYGCVIDYSADSYPHPDAMVIGDAVRDLDDMILEQPEDWRPAPELDRFGEIGAKAIANAWRKMTREKNGVMVLRLKPSDIVIMRAIRGWSAEAMLIEPIEQLFEAHANGQDRWFVARETPVVTGSNEDGSDRISMMPVEVDGWSPVSRRPMPGAYRKPYLDPDPVAAIIARAEHEIWLSCLHLVADACAGRLADIAMMASAVPADPWRPRVPARVRELSDLNADARIEQARQDEMRRRWPRWFKLFEKKFAAPA